MKQKTAIRQLIEFIDKEQGMFKDSFVLEIKNKARQLESVNEQQIIDAYLHSAFNYQYKYKVPTSEQYFNETFEKPLQK